MFTFRLMLYVLLFCVCMSSFVVDIQETDYLWASICMVGALYWLEKMATYWRK